MGNLVNINGQEIVVKEYQGQRVVTFKDIDTVHKRVEGTARKRFNDSKTRLLKDEDFYKISASEFRTRFDPTLSKQVTEDITLIAESGYLMLVKSLNDDLAWEVQRMLVKSYFRNKSEAQPSVPKEDAQLARAEAMLLNARTRAANAWIKLGASFGTPESKQVAHTYAANTLAGKEILALPKVERKSFTATEIGNMFKVSAHMIGKLANANGLKTPEYAIQVWDKAKHSNKQVPTWRYYENAIPIFAKLLGKEVA